MGSSGVEFAKPLANRLAPGLIVGWLPENVSVAIGSGGDDRRVGCDHHRPHRANLQVGCRKGSGNIRRFGASNFGKAAFDRRQIVQSVEAGFSRVARRHNDDSSGRNQQLQQFPPPR
jgi:hypothetical protein